MSRQARPPAKTSGAPNCTVTVCRGGWCGSSRVPGLDHDAQLGHLRNALTEGAQVRISGCLDACEHANVTVVQPSATGRAEGGRPVWLGLVNDADAADDIAAWVHAGGPGVADLSDILGLYVYSPARRIRQGLP
jgi:(2Fe-2S) ferredoxin